MPSGGSARISIRAMTPCSPLSIDPSRPPADRSLWPTTAAIASATSTRIHASGPRSSRPAGWPQRKIRSGRGVAVDAYDLLVGPVHFMCTPRLSVFTAVRSHRRFSSLIKNAVPVAEIDLRRSGKQHEHHVAWSDPDHADQTRLCVVQAYAKLRDFQGALVDAQPHFGQTHVSAPPSRWVSTKSLEKPSS
jgi:hypothetical protein